MGNLFIKQMQRLREAEQRERGDQRDAMSAAE
ncbi:hypothetical protein ENSA5_30230 [Enhygromyxa salina]|uniref:Uncharacterized protein n=1 Tax=Enhygromyxa salina TaxID=215803 RepID=A0A2S9XZZ3_9BACT|nr:hypothetical protein ENSA5_30230 [Enhygromyxa salina]